jgi:hypothetical protein
LALLGLTLAVTGCGETQTTPRMAVASYLNEVNALERQLATPLVVVTRTIVQFSRDARSRRPVRVAPAGQAEALLRSGAQITALRARLSSLTAPAPARRLRVLLLQLVDRQASLTRQMAKLVTFLPGFAQVMAPFGPALVGLERVLSLNQANGSSAVSAVYAEKAAALRNFRAVVLSILSRLRRLDPPAVSLPPYRAQLRSLAAMATTADALAAALQQGSATAAGPLLAQFSQAAAGPSSVTAQKAQIAAIRAYDAELTSLNRLAEAASRERLRLARTLS